MEAKSWLCPPPSLIVSLGVYTRWQCPIEDRILLGSRLTDQVSDQLLCHISVPVTGQRHQPWGLVDVQCKNKHRTKLCTHAVPLQLQSIACARLTGKGTYVTWSETHPSSQRLPSIFISLCTLTSTSRPFLVCVTHSARHRDDRKEQHRFIPVSRS